MQAICRTPREHARPGAHFGKADRRRGATPLLAAALAVALSGCTIVFPPHEEECPDTDELCPNLECENGFAVNDEGCALCECAEEVDPEPTVCWDDAECSEGQRCDVESFCETPPGCSEDQPCPAVCYGRCVDEPLGCASDADCGPDERCSFEGAPTSGGAAPCDPSFGCDGDMPEEPMPPPADGKCVPTECQDVEERPGCPYGTELVIDFSVDPCGEMRCVDVDECRDLSPDVCEQVWGCHLEELPAPCYCEPNSDGSCENVDCGSALVCVADTTTGGECLSDADCFEGQRCELYESCGGVCEVFPDGTSECFSDCAVEGFCVDELPPPPPPPTCEGDEQCAPGYLCEQVEVCTDTCNGGGAEPPPDDGSGDRAMPCMQECHFEGQCVWNPDNTTCWGDLDCGENQRCEYVDGCWIPPDCPNCLVACMGVCVEVEPQGTPCSSDQQCTEGESCNAAEVCNSNPSCDPSGACTDECWGFCVSDGTTTNGGKCLVQEDCAEGFRCADEVDACYCPEGEQCDVCYWQCVPVEDAPPPAP